MSNRILLTGGNGFIGRATCQELLRRDYEVTVLDHAGNWPPPRYEERHITGGDGFGGEGSVSTLVRMPDVILGDIRDEVAVNEAMAHADAWIHLAGVLGTQETILNPLPAAETNVMGGLNILQAAAQYNLPGVCIAVGNHFEDNTYSITKTTVERFCNMYRKYRGMDVTVVRALNAYGPGQSVAAPFGPSKVRKIMPAFVMRALTGQPIEVYGDGSQVMDMIFVDDVADILVTALDETIIRKEQGQPSISEVLSAGTGRRTTVLDIAETVRDAVAKMTNSDPVEIKHLPMRPGETPGVEVIGYPETLEAIGLKDYVFRNLEGGVEQTVQWYYGSHYMMSDDPLEGTGE